MQTNNKQQDKIKLNGEELEGIESLTYLGSIIIVTGGMEEDVKSIIGKARLAFKGPLKYASIRPNLDNTHRGQIWSSACPHQTTPNVT